jgi:hypothetical protein
MIVEKVAYGGWENCFLLTDGNYELVVTGDVGPRVIHFARKGGKNVLYQDPEQMGTVGGEEWRAFGGHRFWHAPESRTRTYQPDNEPVEHFELDNTHYFVPPIEAGTGLQKQISINFSDELVVIDHTFTNNGLWEIELAPWALTVVRAGGVALMPLPPHVSHEQQLLPTHALTLWGYTSMSDSRLRFGDQYLWMRQDEKATSPLKIGLQVNPEYLWTVGWLAYVVEGSMFVKSVQPFLGEYNYPDLGSHLEIFTNNEMLELETLGALRHLKPDETMTHREFWSLHEGVKLPNDDAGVAQDLLPIVREFHPTVGRKQTGTLRALS